MFNPDLSKVLANNTSRYSLVTATAKLARKISEEIEENDEFVTDKPVSMALDKILAGEYVIIEPDEIKNI